MTDQAQTINPSAPRAKRQFATVPFAPVETVRSRLALGDAAFAEAIGYSPSALSDWRKTGRCPKAASLAAEAIMRRQAASDTVFLVRVVKGAARVTILDNPERITFRGKSYLLVSDDAS